MEVQENNAINPSHYENTNGKQCIDIINDMSSKDEYKGFLKGNIIKYIFRCENKENVIQDLKKAKWYLEKLIEFYEI